MFDLVSVLDVVQSHGLYLGALVFFAWYPIFSSAMWVFTSVLFFVRRERKNKAVTAEGFTPPVTILIAAYNEQNHIRATVEGCLQIEYDDFEIVIVDDGSTDETPNILKPYA